MMNVALRPDIRTAGGEVNDIVYNDQFIGTLTLVFRESDRISGAIQLEKESISVADKQVVMSYLQNHIQSLMDALQAKECDIVVTYSSYDHIISTPQDIYEEHQDYKDVEEDFDYEWVPEDTRFDDFDPYGPDEIDMELDRNDSGCYELVIVSEERNAVEYHVYDQELDFIAEVFVKMYGKEIVGTVEWKFDPINEEMDHVAELITADFNENDFDSLILHMKYEGEIIETIELTHEDVLDASEQEPSFGMPNLNDYTIVLARDDGDTLTYEIYQQSHGGLPIGVATVDISERQLTGFMDLRDPGHEDDRETIAILLMEELDKEKEYDTFNLTMLSRNEWIDEIHFESEQVH